MLSYGERDMRPKNESSETLWKRYHQGRKIEDRNALVEHYAPLIHSHAARMSRRLPGQVTYDEIVSAAFDGLIEAVQAYDPSRKAKFETFCQQRISGAVKDWLRSLDLQSRTVRTFERQRMVACEALDSRLNRAPSAPEVAQEMGLTTDRYERLLRLSRLGKAVHFSAMEPPTDPRGRSMSGSWDVGDCRENDPSKRVAREMFTEYVTRGLSREERLTLVLYYYEGLTMEEIGHVLDLSESRVSQIHKDILARLRLRFTGSVEEEMVA
jgi:RNA polymerase sigma factor for flagellar operon FliA